MVRFDLVIDAGSNDRAFWKAVDAVSNLDEFFDRLVIFSEGRSSDLLAECTRRSSPYSRNERGRNIVLFGTTGRPSNAWQDYVRLLGKRILDLPRCSLLLDTSQANPCPLDLDDLYARLVANKTEVDPTVMAPGGFILGRSLEAWYSKFGEKDSRPPSSASPLLLLFDSRWDTFENFRSLADDKVLKNVQVISRGPIARRVKRRLQKLARRLTHPFERDGVLVRD